MSIASQIDTQLNEFIQEVDDKHAADPSDIMLASDVLEDTLNGGFQYYKGQGHVLDYDVYWEDDCRIRIDFTCSDDPSRVEQRYCYFQHLDGDGVSDDLTSSADDAYDRAMRGI